jgi:hypothetical protein
MLENNHSPLTTPTGVLSETNHTENTSSRQKLLSGKSSVPVTHDSIDATIETEVSKKVPPPTSKSFSRDEEISSVPTTLKFTN